MDQLGITTPREPSGKLVGSVQDPAIAGVGREQEQVAEVDEAAIITGSLLLDVKRLVDKTEALAVHPSVSGLGISKSLALSRIW